MGDSEMRNCLICESPTNEVHLGIDTCRACSIFYKRTVKLNKESLKCMTGTDDCIENKPTTSCRKCRFRKFSDMLESARDVRDESESASSVENVTQPSTSFLDHESFSLRPSPSSDTPLLDRIKNGYCLLCLIRKTGEVPLVPTGVVPVRENIGRDQLDFYPTNYSLVLPVARIYVSAFIDFGNAVFDEFRILPNEEKATFVVASYNIFVLMDTAYRSIHYFPDSDTALSGYIFTVDNDDTEAFLDTCPCEINKEELAKVFRQKSIELIKMKEHFKLLAPTDNEFALLLALSFWSNAVSIASEPMTPIVEKYRKAAMNELHTTYKQQGRRDYAARLGELMCLLSNIEELCTLSKTDLELYKLMNIFNF